MDFLKKQNVFDYKFEIVVDLQNLQNEITRARHYIQRSSTKYNYDRRMVVVDGQKRSSDFAVTLLSTSNPKVFFFNTWDKA